MSQISLFDDFGGCYTERPQNLSNQGMLDPFYTRVSGSRSSPLAILGPHTWLPVLTHDLHSRVVVHSNGIALAGNDMAHLWTINRSCLKLVAPTVPNYTYEQVTIPILVQNRGREDSTFC